MRSRHQIELLIGAVVIAVISLAVLACAIGGIPFYSMPPGLLGTLARGALVVIAGFGGVIAWRLGRAALHDAA
jgi:hypothetical protein